MGNKCVIKLLQAPKAIKGWAAELFTRLFITGKAYHHLPRRGGKNELYK